MAMLITSCTLSAASFADMPRITSLYSSSRPGIPRARTTMIASFFGIVPTLFASSVAKYCFSRSIYSVRKPMRVLHPLQTAQNPFLRNPLDEIGPSSQIPVSEPILIKSIFPIEAIFDHFASWLIKMMKTSTLLVFGTILVFTAAVELTKE